MAWYLNGGEVNPTDWGGIDNLTALGGTERSNTPDTSTWQGLLRSGFQRPPEENFYSFLGGYDPSRNIYDEMVRRIDATGWSDSRKREAVQQAITNHRSQFGSGFTEYSTPEGIAGLLGLPDYNNATHGTQDQAYLENHAEQARLDNEESLANAMRVLGAAGTIGMGFGGLLGPVTDVAGQAVGA